MSDVTGVTAEETTVVDSVENTSPVVGETKAETPVEDNVEGEADNAEDKDVSQDAELSDEDLEQLENDPKVKAFLKKKTEAQKQALKHSQQAIEKRNTEATERNAKIERQQERIAELEAKQTQDLDENDFDTQEEFEAAQRKQDAKDAVREEQIGDAKAKLNAEVTERYEAAFTGFKEQLEEVKKTKPEVEQSVQAMAVELQQIRKYAPNDAGVAALENFITYDAENGVLLTDRIMTDPTVRDALYGKPPHRIVEILKGYDKELSAPKETPAPTPLPTPPSKAKGSATSKNLHSGDVLKNLGLK